MAIAFVVLLGLAVLCTEMRDESDELAKALGLALG